MVCDPVMIIRTPDKSDLSKFMRKKPSQCRIADFRKPLRKTRSRIQRDKVRIALFFSLRIDCDLAFFCKLISVNPTPAGDLIRSLPKQMALSPHTPYRENDACRDPSVPVRTRSDRSFSFQDKSLADRRKEMIESGLPIIHFKKRRSSIYNIF